MGARSYGCVKCGHTYTAYPPDDVHVVACRIKSPFLEEIRVGYVCSRCKEVLYLYWGRPVAGKSALQAMHRLLAFAKGLRKSEGEETDQPVEDASLEEVDKTVYDYIESNNGSILVNKAAEDLEIPPDVIKESLQRLSLAGKLTPPD